MDRRNFMALIPSLSALPIIGKHIEKDKEKIVIYQPEDVQKYTPRDFSHFDFMKARVQVVQDGQILAEGYLTEICVDAPMIQMGVTMDGQRFEMPGARHAEVTGTLVNFFEMK